MAKTHVDFIMDDYLELFYTCDYGMDHLLKSDGSKPDTCACIQYHERPDYC